MKDIFSTRAIVFVLLLLAAATTSVELSAQCDDISLSLTPISSTCLANGSIKVVVSGADAVNISQTDMQFQVSGTVNRTWANYPNDSITNLPAGTYTIELRAFCIPTDNFVVVANAVATTSLSSTYTEMNAVRGVIRSTLSCKPTGMIPITIMTNTGSAPYTITMTGYPATYTGLTGFSTSTTGTPFQITGLPAGSYTFTVSDNCSYTTTLSGTVGTMPATGETAMINSTYFYRTSTVVPNGCDTVLLYRPNLSSYSADQLHYYYTNSADYYEIAYLVNNSNPGAINPADWQPLQSNTTYLGWKMPPPYSIRTLRDNNYYVYPFLRVAGTGTSCIIPLNAMRVYPTPSITMSYDDIGCIDQTVRFTPSNSYTNLFCYPYQWRIIDNSNNVIFPDTASWVGPVSAATQQTATKVPFGSRIQFLDSEGFTWTQTLLSSAPTIYGVNSTAPYMSLGITDSIFHSLIYFYLSPSASFPAQTRFRFLSGPMTPVNTDSVIATSTANYFPFTSSYSYMLPGVYQYEITLPGCPPRTANCNVTVYKLKEIIAYRDAAEDCDGLTVYPTGQITQINYSTLNETNNMTFFRIISSVPSNIPFNGAPVTAGNPLYLPTSGDYRIGMAYDMSITTPSSMADTTTFHYTQTPFSLDPEMSSAYLCQGESVGFMHLKGMGGSGTYRYMLFDGVVPIDSNSTGIFHYGNAGQSYTIRLIDDICASSYDQDMTIIDLGIAHIAYTNATSNLFCLSDSIFLKCITLGETTYEWSGPGITPANYHMQQVPLAAEDLGVGTHKFYIEVTPEGCGYLMRDSVTITVEDCSGAHDDFLVQFMNTTDSVDILANDAFPSGCASSVAPVVTVPPTQGVYTLANGIVYYTPNTDFIGPDSLTYSTTCGTTTTTAKVYFTVIEYPDNISSAACILPPESTVWGIREAPINNNVLINNYGPLVAGDIDADGVVEIIGFLPDTRSTNNYESNGLRVFRMNSGQVQHVKDIAFNGHTTPTFGAMAIARYNNTGYIVVCGSDGYLYAYNYATGARLWQSSATIGQSTGSIVNIADFNGDGIPEVYSGNRIYSLHNGVMLCDGGSSNNKGKLMSAVGFSSIAADVDGDGRLELCAGTQIYRVTIPPGATSAAGCVMAVINDMQLASVPSGADTDGATTVADIDCDGELEVIVTTLVAGRVTVYVWKPLPGNASRLLCSYLVPALNVSYFGIPMIGNIDSDPYPEILFITNGNNGAGTNVWNMYALKYNPSAAMTAKWTLPHTDGSGCTGMTLFDFNLDGVNEIVYRDETTLRIIDGSGASAVVRATFNNVRSGTLRELPIIADVDGDGQAEIVIQGWDNVGRTVGGMAAGIQNGYLRVFKSNGSTWAYARKVWNQYAYNALNIRENLTVPQAPVSVATAFSPGPDGIWGTVDDVRPFNGFLMQQTMLNSNGEPLWLVPDIYPAPALCSYTVIGDSVSFNIGIVNQGDAPVGSPVYVSLYRETLPQQFAGVYRLATDSANIQILPGDTGYVRVGISSLSAILPLAHVAVRVNDRGSPPFPHQAECDVSNNDLLISVVSHTLTLMVSKEARLLIPPSDTVVYDGSYSNPAAALYSDTVEYTITAVNPHVTQENVIIVDTVPAYLTYISSSPSLPAPPTTGTPPRTVLNWTVATPPAQTAVVAYKATPQSGVSASQPMFINRAWVHIGADNAPTNAVYHQGAGVGVVTFSASSGGRIRHAAEQALDYRTTPRPGIIVVPDEGYRFTGWSHAAYQSLRGATIPAQSGIMLYDTLTVYGSVNLLAEFEPETNPNSYQLHGGQEEIAAQLPEQAVGDKIWAANGELLIRTSRPGGIVRIYSMEGVLQRQQIIIRPGETKIKLPVGMYVVTLNNGTGVLITNSVF